MLGLRYVAQTIPLGLTLDVRGRGPVAAAQANVNKQYSSVPFDQLIAQQSLLRVSLQPDRCQQLDSVASAYHYRSSSSRLSTSDRCGINSTRRATCSPFTASTFSVWRKGGSRTLTMLHHIRALQSIDSFKVALKKDYLLAVWLLVTEYLLLPRQRDSRQPYGWRAPL